MWCVSIKQITNNKIKAIWGWQVRLQIVVIDNQLERHQPWVVEEVEKLELSEMIGGSYLLGPCGKSGFFW